MWHRSLIVCAVGTLGFSAFLMSCASKSVTSPTTVADVHASSIARPTLAATRPVDLPGIHNVVAYADGVYSGGVPEGKEGFETLKKLGVKSILSVDGTAPDVELARAEGFHYVHLPVTYSGISEERRVEITRAVQTLPRPIFIHCHHGKHRSAAATAIAMVGLGVMTPTQAVDRMKVSGTAPNYKGLYQCVNLASVIDTDTLAKTSTDFPELWKTSGFVNTMVAVDDAFDHLKLIEKAGWQAPAEHPDLVPVAESGRLHDLFRSAGQEHETADHPPEFAEWLKTAGEEASALEQSLAGNSIDRAAASAKFAQVAQSCKSCHAKYRD